MRFFSILMAFVLVIAAVTGVGVWVATVIGDPWVFAAGALTGVLTAVTSLVVTYRKELVRTRRTTAARAREKELIAGLEQLEAAAQATLFGRDLGVVSSPIRLRSDLLKLGVWTKDDVEAYDRVLRIRNGVIHGDVDLAEAAFSEVMGAIVRLSRNLDMPAIAGPAQYVEAVAEALRRVLVGIAPIGTVSATHGAGRGYDLAVESNSGTVFVEVKYYRHALISESDVSRLAVQRQTHSRDVLVISNGRPSSRAAGALNEYGIPLVQWRSAMDDSRLAMALDHAFAQGSRTTHKASATVWPRVVAEDSSAQGAKRGQYLLVLRNTGDAPAHDVRFHIEVDDDARGPWVIVGGPTGQGPALETLAPAGEVRYKVLPTVDSAASVRCTVTWSDASGVQKSSAILHLVR
jgi:hypothetical protein